MNILLTGSTGFIGGHLLKRLLQEGHQVTASVRKLNAQAKSHPQLHTVAKDFMQATNIDDWLPHLKSIDVVINAVGIISENKQQSFAHLHSDAPAALFSAAEMSGVRRVIQISALGADQDAKSEYHLSKLVADDVLISLDLDWFILRPSLVYGEGAQSMNLFRAMAALPIIPLIEGGRQKMQPVHVDDLVNAIVNCLDERVPARITVDVVGPEEVNMKELLLKQRKWLGLKTTKTVSIPLKWMLRIMPFTGWLNEPALTKQSLKMLQRDNVSDVSAFEIVLGAKPSSMDSVMAKNQVSIAQRRDARWYFMRSLFEQNHHYGQK